MNRAITGIGIGILLGTFSLIAFPIVVTGQEVFDLEQEAGILLLPMGLVVILLGASSPDPRRTTITGVFGNPDEVLLRKQLSATEVATTIRYHSNPRETVNCRNCYTAIPYDVLSCPRCGRRRECRNCLKPLFWIAGGVRCLPCARVEYFCNCPRVQKVVSKALSVRMRGHR